MMNELNKRANLLIEQLEVITFSSLFYSMSFLFRSAADRALSWSVQNIMSVLFNVA